MQDTYVAKNIGLRQPSIPQSDREGLMLMINKQSEALEELSSLLNELHNKIDVILMPPMPTKPETPAYESSELNGCQAMCNVASNTCKVRSLQQRLVFIIGNLNL